MASKGTPSLVSTAVLPGLVDILRTDDSPDSPRVFFFQDNKIVERIEEKEEGRILIPAGRTDTGWLPPKLGAVIGAYRDLKAGKLTTEILFKRVRNKLESYCRLPDPTLYDVLAAWIFHTYRMDWWQRTPIVMLYGPPDTGKNQVGGAVTYLSYRGEDHGMLTAANVFRGAQLLESTLFFDVSRLNLALRRDGLEEVLIKRTQKEGTVRRVIDPSLADLGGQRTFRPWGPTIIATNEIPASDAVLSRSLFIPMAPVDTHYAIPTPEELGGLQEQLVAWRWLTLIEGTKPDPKVQGQGVKRWRQMTRAVQQITTLLAPSHLEVVDKGLAYFRSAQKQVRSQGDIADVLAAVVDAVAKNSQTPGRVATKALLDAYREATGDERASIKAFSHHLHALGLKPGAKLEGGNKRGWSYDPAALKRREQELGLEE